ncbi:MAG: PqqD family protein [Gaiellaceae bacterium]
MSEILRLRDKGLEWRLLEGEIVALDSSAEKYLAVNSSGAVLWAALALGATREDLVARLSEEFDLDEHLAARDLDAFIAALDAQGLLARGA